MAALYVAVIVVVVAFYRSISEMISNPGDATATLNRALNDVEDAAEACIELADLELEEANR
jgi:Sec-independent protein translocase protein TatA